MNAKNVLSPSQEMCTPVLFKECLKCPFLKKYVWNACVYHLAYRMLLSHRIVIFLPLRMSEKVTVLYRMSRMKCLHNFLWGEPASKCFILLWMPRNVSISTGQALKAA